MKTSLKSIWEGNEVHTFVVKGLTINLWLKEKQILLFTLICNLHESCQWFGTMLCLWRVNQKWLQPYMSLISNCKIIKNVTRWKQNNLCLTCLLFHDSNWNHTTTFQSRGLNRLQEKKRLAASKWISISMHRIKQLFYSMWQILHVSFNGVCFSRLLIKLYQSKVWKETCRLIVTKSKK